MIVPGDALVRAFRRIGWGGGRWTSAKDDQHFSANGR
jgi:D-alanyl-D-alanine carboxypeptidase